MKSAKKRAAGLISLALALAAVLTLTLAACDFGGNKKGDPASAASFVTVDINPSFEMVLDEKNVVLSVNAANSDAEVLLWEEDGIVGASLEVAIEKITSLAVQMGYLTDDNNHVSVTVAAQAEADEQAIYDAINAKISAIASDNNISAHVNYAVDLALSGELARVKAQNAGKEGYAELDIARYRLVRSAMSADRNLKMDDAVKKTNKELIDIVEKAEAKYEQKFGEVYEKAVNEARFALELAKMNVIDTCYFTVIDPGHADLIHLTISKYVALRNAYATLDHYYYTLRDYIENPVFDEEDAQALYNLLGTTIAGPDCEAFKAEITENEGGQSNITADSVKSYINKLHRNASDEDKAKLEQVYADVDEMIAGLYKAKEIIGSATETLINAGLVVLGVDGNVDFNDPASVETTLTKMSEKIAEIKAEIDGQLTEAQKTRLETLQNTRTDDLEAAQQTFENAVKTARETAEAWLNQAKQERLEYLNGPQA